MIFFCVAGDVLLPWTFTVDGMCVYVAGELESKSGVRYPETLGYACFEAMVSARWRYVTKSMCASDDKTAVGTKVWHSSFFFVWLETKFSWTL